MVIYLDHIQATVAGLQAAAAATLNDDESDAYLQFLQVRGRLPQEEAAGQAVRRRHRLKKIQ